MTFRNLFIEHDRSAAEQAWLDEERAEQETRFSQIERQMHDLKPQRERWYREFFTRITHIGFNVDGDDKVKIAPADIPLQPEGRADQVVWKYGVDSDKP